jgi:hypothetical protein
MLFFEDYDYNYKGDLTDELSKEWIFDIKITGGHKFTWTYV